MNYRQSNEATRNSKSASSWNLLLSFIQTTFSSKTARAGFAAIVAFIAIACFGSLSGQAATLTVNKTADTNDGVCNLLDCSLREAITVANNTPGTDTIAFNILGAGVHTISLLSALPTITDPVVINGYTQPLSSANTLANGDNAVLLIELDGTNAGQNISGLAISEGSSTVQGLVINHFDGNAILLISKGGNLIAGNYFGTNASGTAKAVNSYGIYVQSSAGNTIGGTTPAARNLISGSSAIGIAISGAGSDNNLIQGNFIGTNASGTAALSNNTGGVGMFLIGKNPTGNIIGGATAGAGNLISGNTYGINLGLDVSGVQIAGNLIGTDVTGKKAVSNIIGVFVQTASDQTATIGGDFVSTRNIISGNTSHGIVVSNQSSGVLIKANYIGTDISGNVALGNGQSGIESLVADLVIELNVISGNQGSGVLLTSSNGIAATGNRIINNWIGYAANGITALGNGGDGVRILSAASNNTVGGAGGAGNSIAHNAGAGVHVVGGAGNVISSNKIVSNKALGIDLDSAGVTANDPGDGDAGPNNLQNYPAITSAVTNGIMTTIQGSLNSAPNTQFHLEFFANAFADSSGFGQGEIFIGSTDVTTNANSDVSFNVTLAVFLSSSQYVSATATDPAGNTSEFSVCTKLDSAPPAMSVNDLSTVEGNSGVKTVSFAVALTHPYALPVIVNYSTADGTATAGIDYLATSGLLTFAPGQTTQTIAVIINGDTQFEPDETLFVNLSNPANAILNKGKATGTILNDDVQSVGTLAFGAASYSVNESVGQATISVTRTAGSAGAVSIQYDTTNGTATATSDYTSASGTLNWADGDTAVKTFTIPITNDSLDEADETVNLTLSNPTGGATLGSPSSAGLAIIDDDPAPKVSIDDVSVAEGNSGTTNLTFTVSLSGASGQTVSVNYTTFDNTAQMGGDYQAANGVVTFAQGETSKQITMLVNGDTQVESNETFAVNLFNLINASVGKVSGLGTIVNDDSNSASPAIQFSQAVYSAPEDLGAMTVTVTRSGDTSSAASVDYTTLDGSAAQKADFEYAAGTLTFAPGETSKTFTVLLNEDMFIEGSETFNIVLSNPAGAALGAQSTSKVTIVDDLPESISNPIDDAQAFVYTNYHDFLNRQPDAAGLAFWTNEIASCGNDAKCIEAKRVNVSASFFLSIEFQETAYLLYLIQKESYATLPKYNAFMRDLQEISRGVIVNSPGWQQKLSDNQQQFADKWINRPEFKTVYDALSNDDFVNALYKNAGIVPAQTAKDKLVAALNTANMNRTAVLLEVAGDASFRQQEQNPAFVMMEYFGYLRRDPDAAPDSDLSGYNFWLNKLNQFGGNYIDAEMVRSFVLSSEYRQRFGQ